MPIYEYKCTEEHEAPAHQLGTELCGHEYEVFYTSVGRVEDEEPLEKCPSCGGTSKEKLISKNTTHILKGGGWFHSGGY